MASLVPPGLEGKEDVLFGNLNELYSFHNDIFLKDLENCISTTELVALCFVQRVRIIDRCENFETRNQLVSLFYYSATHSIVCTRTIVKIFHDPKGFERHWSIHICSCKNVRNVWDINYR